MRVSPGRGCGASTTAAPPGKRWAVEGEFTGSAEVWLEEWADAVVVHVFWQVDPVGRTPLSARRLDRYAVTIKRHVMGLKDTLEAGRAPGTPRGVPAGE